MSKDGKANFRSNAKFEMRYVKILINSEMGFNSTERDFRLLKAEDQIQGLSEVMVQELFLSLKSVPRSDLASQAHKDKGTQP